MTNWDVSGGSKGRVLVALLAALVAFDLCGCSRSAPKNWDANGYLDTVTGYKFYTDKDVFAEKSPQRPSDRIVQVLAFVFPDGKVIIAPRDVQNLYEPQTHMEPKTIRYPSAAELKAWGAVKVTSQEVCK